MEHDNMSSADSITAQKPKIVFLGSGPVAAKSLELLLEWCDIEAVITKPQPEHHKHDFPVIVLAQEHQLPTLFASNRRELDELMSTQTFDSRLGIIIDFGIIVSQHIIDFFELGIVNSHFSLLPELRGADPITFSIINGLQQTGVSLMLLVQAMDEGPLLAQATYELSDSTTTPSLTADLIDLSDQSLREIIPLYLQGQVDPAPQDQVALSGHQTATYSRKLSKQDSVLDFANTSAVQLEREVRAFIEWPKSRTVLAGKDVIVTKAHVATAVDITHKPGDVDTLGVPGSIAITTNDGSLFCIDMLKPAGKPEMTAKAFLAGNKLS
jgi:methionyl-tRNA formyltransferase